MEVINVSDFPENKIYILFNKTYRENLIKKAMKKLKYKSYFELSLWLNKILKSKFNGGDIKYWIEGERLDKRTNRIHPKFMPLSLALTLVDLDKEGKESLHKNIIAYRSGGKGLVINKPKLPIKVTPELESIIIHLFGDGAAGDFTPSYTQKNKSAMENFIKKLENCFGDFEKSIYFTQGKYQVKFPKAITDILSKHYLIISYRSHESIIPLKILKREDKKFKLACIIAFIVDEGGIRDVVSLYSTNKKLLGGIRKLILDCNYICSKIQCKKANSYVFTLSNKNISKFYKNTLQLAREFPTCNLLFKDENLKFIIKRRKRINPKNRKVTERVIFNILKNNRLTALEISKLTNYAYCTIIHNLERLFKEKRIKRIEIKDRTYRWELY